MLDIVQRSPRIPTRITWSAAELVERLRQAGRFRQLGLTDSEGVRLVEAVYRHLDLPLEGRPTAESAGAFAAAPPFPVRAGTEFENLSSVLMRWPFDWVAVRDEYVIMAEAFTRNGTVTIWVDTESQRQAAEQLLVQGGVPLNKVTWRVENTDSVWLRDYGPQFLVAQDGSKQAIADFHYYSSRPADDEIPAKIAQWQNIPVVDRQTGRNTVYTEGGNLGHDGVGSVIYSERTYTKNRLPARIVDQRILSAFQATRGTVLVDPRLDATGHVDMFTKILNANTIFVGQYDPDEFDYARLEESAARLAASPNGAGQPWTIVRMPQPDVYYVNFVLPVVRTYTNAQMSNGVVVVPIYGLPTDQTALNLYQTYLPGRTVIGLNANDIIESAGAWHCVTMEWPQAGREWPQAGRSGSF
jgi:agmatine deiminase